MFLLESDVLRLLSHIPYFTLGKHASAKRLVAAMVRDGEELEAMLRQFPAVQYEPLEQHYVLLRCLGTLSEELVSDLCVSYAWHGVVWAAWLVALAPSTQYRKHLVSARGHVPHNQWLVDLALAEIDGRAWPMDADLQALVQRLRFLLSQASMPTTVLRHSPGKHQLSQIEAERERVKSAYHSGGLDAALQELKRSEILCSLSPRE